MPWVRFADDYLTNGKIKDLDAAARLLDLCSVMYSARELRDGELSASDVQTVAILAKVRRWKAAVDELVGVGRWLRCANGNYLIHDYLDYQPSRAEVLAERDEKHQAKVKAGRAGGLASGISRSTRGSKSEAKGEANDIANAKQKGSPVPGTNVVNPAGSGSSPAGRLPGRARASREEEPTVNAQLLAAHLELIARDRASRGQPSQPDSKSSENGETKDDAHG
jgi:hypothetical protein